MISSTKAAREDAIGYSRRGPAAFFIFAGFSYAVIALMGMWFPL